MLVRVWGSEKVTEQLCACPGGELRKEESASWKNATTLVLEKAIDCKQ